MSNPNNKQIVIPIGFNALVNDANRTVILIGEYKTAGKADTSLRLISKPTEAELIADLPAGYATLPTPKA